MKETAPIIIELSPESIASLKEIADRVSLPVDKLAFEMFAVGWGVLVSDHKKTIKHSVAAETSLILPMPLPASG